MVESSSEFLFLHLSDTHGLTRLFFACYSRHGNTTVSGGGVRAVALRILVVRFS